MITQQRLRELLDYNPDTGIFTWKKGLKGTAQGGTAGYMRYDGYIKISIDGQPYLAHRLAWVYVFGSNPIKMLDHIDRNPSNNSIGNLRLATPALNNANTEIKNKYGYRGIGINRRGGWIASISIKGKVIKLGNFSTKEAAAKAYQDALNKLLHSENMKIEEIKHGFYFTSCWQQ